MKYVVIHHALHSSEGVYRLVYAQATDDEEPVYFGHQEVVWDASDERWAERTGKDIAAEQRQLVKEVIAERLAAEERQADFTPLADSEGTEL
jgi:hypothetical protein